MSRMKIRRGVFLSIAMVAVVDSENAIAQLPKTSSPTTPLPSLSLPPNVSDWSPRGRVYPGQVLVIRGQGFDPSQFVVRVGSGTQVIALPVASGTSTEIRATVPGQFTGSAGAPLTVRHSGGQSRELESAFKILPRDAKFVGPSLWHITDATTTSIFSRGTVTLNLELLAFAQSGQGSYSEVVDLVRRISESQENCTTNIGAPGTRTVSEFRFVTQRPSRAVTWARLPDGRIEIRQAGVDPLTIVATVSAQVAGANFSTTAAGPHTEPATTRSICIGASLGDPPPLVGVPLRRVEWSLARQ